MRSTCIPRLESISADLLIAEGCSDLTNDHWYTILHEDGSPVLKGTLHPWELSLLPATDTSGSLFALAVPDGGPRYTRGSTFHGADLAPETVRIHREADGREVSLLRIQAPPPSSQPIALSSSGDQVAVIDGDQLLLYQLP